MNKIKKIITGDWVINFKEIKNIERFRNIYKLYYKKLLRFEEPGILVNDYLSDLTLQEIESKIVNSSEYKEYHDVRLAVKEKLNLS